MFITDCVIKQYINPEKYKSTKKDILLNKSYQSYLFQMVIA